MQVGISMVGLSSVLSGEGSSTHKVSTEEMLLGMGLIVASQVSGARAVTVEHECVRMLLFVKVKEGASARGTGEGNRSGSGRS